MAKTAATARPHLPSVDGRNAMPSSQLLIKLAVLPVLLYTSFLLALTFEPIQRQSVPLFS